MSDEKAEVAQRLLVWMRADEKKFLAYVSKKEGISMSTIGRLAIEVFLAAYLQKGPESLYNMDILKEQP